MNGGGGNSNVSGIISNMSSINGAVTGAGGATAMNSSQIGAAQQQAEAHNAAIKAQKEKDLKEELRRINRNWNAKAEEEKKKVPVSFIFDFSCIFLVYF